MRCLLFAGIHRNLIDCRYYYFIEGDTIAFFDFNDVFIKVQKYKDPGNIIEFTFNEC